MNLVGQFTCGRRAGCKLSLPLPGASANDLLNSSNNWMKSIVIERLLFGYFFLAVDQKFNG
jgi:hypothetical protein